LFYTRGCISRGHVLKHFTDMEGRRMKPLFTGMAYIALSDASGRDVRSHRSSPPRGGAGNLRRIATAAVGGLVSLMLLAGTAYGKDSVFLPAPSYPNSTLAIKVAGKPRAGKVVKTVITGSNAPFEIGYPGSGDYLAYQLDVFAQNGKVLPNCPRTFGEELQNEINLGIGRIAQGLTEGYYGPFGIPIRFQTSRSVRNIVVCAYSRLVDDDAAVSALGFKLRPPRCTCRRR
jgi:hypothetical protein